MLNVQAAHSWSLLFGRVYARTHVFIEYVCVCVCVSLPSLISSLFLSIYQSISSCATIINLSPTHRGARVYTSTEAHPYHILFICGCLCVYTNTCSFSEIVALQKSESNLPWLTDWLPVVPLSFGHGGRSADHSIRQSEFWQNNPHLPAFNFWLSLAKAHD